MNRLEKFEAYDWIDESSWTGPIETCRWVDDDRGDEIRSRVVARQFAQEVMYGIFAGTPNHVIFR